MTIDPTWIAMLGTVCGGVGLKISEKWLNHAKDKRDDRKEFREEIKELQDRLDNVEDDLAEWRGKYYAAQEQILILKAMMVGAGLTIPDD